VNEDVYTEVCEYKFLYSVISYGIVAILALIHVFRKIHTAFIWPTLSTLVTFNILLKSVNFAMRYAYCIVGGLAWEGFNFYQGKRTEVEQDYIFAVAIVYRKFQQDSDTDIDPQVILASFYFFEWISGLIFIYFVLLIFYVLCWIVSCNQSSVF